MKNLLLEWSDWFVEPFERRIADTYSSSFSVVNHTYIHFCVFSHIFSSITFDSSSSYISLCIEECSFLDCTRADSYYGGAIYFNGGSNCVLNKICANQCFTAPTTKKHGQFCYNSVRSGLDYKNIAELVSVSRCAPSDNGFRRSSIYFFNGNISVNSINSTSNVCYTYSGVRIAYSLYSLTKQSTFSNNTDSTYFNIAFSRNSHFIYQCNIIRNRQLFPDYGNIYNDEFSRVNMDNCIIDFNSGATNSIYSQEGSEFVLQNCYTQSDIPTSGNVNILNPKSNSNSLINMHFQTEKCVQQNPYTSVTLDFSQIYISIDSPYLHSFFIVTVLVFLQ